MAINRTINLTSGNDFWDALVHPPLNANDTVRAKAGNDTVYGWNGNDRLFGEAGNDTLHGENGFDQLAGGRGQDVIFAGGGSDLVTWADGDGSDSIYGEEGFDMLWILGSTSSADQLSLATDGGSLLVAGNRGPFQIAASGIERLEIHGGAGNGSLSATLPVAGTGVSVIAFLGGDGDDQFFGSSGPIDPSGAIDTGLDLQGGAGNDYLLGGAFGDYLDGGLGNDNLRGGDLEGQPGDDLLLGGPGDDLLYGGQTGADTLNGGWGSDRLTPSNRAPGDTFIFECGPEQGIDNIGRHGQGAYFHRGLDQILVYGVSEDQIDTNGDNVLDHNDDAVVSGIGSSDLYISFDLPFPGFGGGNLIIQNHTELTVGTDIVFMG